MFLPSRKINYFLPNWPTNIFSPDQSCTGVCPKTGMTARAYEEGVLSILGHSRSDVNVFSQLLAENCALNLGYDQLELICPVNWKLHNSSEDMRSKSIV